MAQGYDTLEEAAKRLTEPVLRFRGADPQCVRVLATRVLDDEGCVLLDMGSAEQPELYGVHCLRTDGRWLGDSGSSLPWSWYQRTANPDLGTLVVWGEAPQGALAVRTDFGHTVIEEPITNGVYLAMRRNVPEVTEEPQERFSESVAQGSTRTGTLRDSMDGAEQGAAYWHCHRPVEPRPLTTDESTVIRVALERASVQPVDPIVLQRLSELRVVGECACGCGSVDFVEGEARLQSCPIAEGTGKTAADGDVEIIVWGTASAVTGLEVLDRGAGDHDIRLPTPASIIPW